MEVPPENARRKSRLGCPTDRRSADSRLFSALAIDSQLSKAELYSLERLHLQDAPGREARQVALRPIPVSDTGAMVRLSLVRSDAISYSKRCRVEPSGA